MKLRTMLRDDLSNKLIHLTKGGTKKEPDYNEAAKNFIKIVSQRELIGSSGIEPGRIRSSNRCVCFSEAPISKLATILSEPNIFGVKYAPFGIMFDKKWLFKKGGRPVIYQPESEFEYLSEEQKYRHMAFNISPSKKEQYVDFTFEREWRINTDTEELNGILKFEPEDATLVLPNREWESKFINEWFEYYNMRRLVSEEVQKLEEIYSVCMGVENYHFVYYPWHVLVLEDLGVNIYDPNTIESLKSKELLDEAKFFIYDSHHNDVIRPINLP